MIKDGIFVFILLRNWIVFSDFIALNNLKINDRFYPSNIVPHSQCLSHKLVYKPLEYSHSYCQVITVVMIAFAWNTFRYFARSAVKYPKDGKCQQFNFAFCYSPYQSQSWTGNELQHWRLGFTPVFLWSKHLRQFRSFNKSGATMVRYLLFSVLCRSVIVW